MKKSFSLIALIACCSCSCTSVKTVRVGNLDVTRVTFRSIFGPYQALNFVAPTNNPGAIRHLQSDSNVGPGSALFSAAIKATGLVGFGHQVRNVGRENTSTSVQGSNASATGGNASATGGNSSGDGDGSHNDNGNAHK